jgi:hypothetical protein
MLPCWHWNSVNWFYSNYVPPSQRPTKHPSLHLPGLVTSRVLLCNHFCQFLHWKSHHLVIDHWQEDLRSNCCHHNHLLLLFFIGFSVISLCDANSVVTPPLIFSTLSPPAGQWDIPTIACFCLMELLSL